MNSNTSGKYIFKFSPYSHIKTHHLFLHSTGWTEHELKFGRPSTTAEQLRLPLWLQEAIFEENQKKKFHLVIPLIQKKKKVIFTLENDSSSSYNLRSKTIRKKKENFKFCQHSIGIDFVCFAQFQTHTHFPDYSKKSFFESSSR